MHCCLSYETIKCMTVEEPDGLNTDLRSVELSICSYKLSMPIFTYLISCLVCLVRRDLSIFWATIYRTLDFCASERRLNNTRRHFTCLGVILIRYAQYILALRMRYVRYTLACNARSLSSFEFTRHFESHLARPPPFYMRMQTRRLQMNIPLLLCYTLHVLYSQPIRLIIRVSYHIHIIHQFIELVIVNT